MSADDDSKARTEPLETTVVIPYIVSLNILTHAKDPVALEDRTGPGLLCYP